MFGQCDVQVPRVYNEAWKPPMAFFKKAKLFKTIKL